MKTYVSHMIVDGATLCGAPFEPVPYREHFDVAVCEPCVTAATTSGVLLEELTIRHIRHSLDQAREYYQRYRDGLGPKARAAHREQLLMIAATSLVDAEASPVFYDDAQLLAVGYAAGTIRAALYHLVSSGMPVTWPVFERLIVVCLGQILEIAQGGASRS